MHKHKFPYPLNVISINVRSRKLIILLVSERFPTSRKIVYCWSGMFSRTEHEASAIQNLVSRNQAKTKNYATFRKFGTLSRSF